jgi:hypothetical protein
MFAFDLDKKIEQFLSELSYEICSYDSSDKNVDKDTIDFRLHNVFNRIVKVKFKNLDYKYNSIYKDPMESEQCIAVLKTGPNKGKLCNKSVYCNNYCKTHSKSVNKDINKDDNKIVNKVENKNINTDDVVSEDTKQDNKFSDEEDNNLGIKNIIVNKEPPVNKNQIVININKFGNFVFGDTGLVINNQKRVIAKEGTNGEWLTLNDEDIELCKQHKLKYEVIEHNRAVPETTYSITSQFSILRADWDN